jgi:hypothetical protein
MKTKANYLCHDSRILENCFVEEVLRNGFVLINTSSTKKIVAKPNSALGLRRGLIAESPHQGKSSLVLTLGLI